MFIRKEQLTDLPMTVMQKCRTITIKLYQSFRINWKSEYLHVCSQYSTIYITFKQTKVVWVKQLYMK